VLDTPGMPSAVVKWPINATAIGAPIIAPPP